MYAFVCLFLFNLSTSPPNTITIRVRTLCRKRLLSIVRFMGIYFLDIVFNEIHLFHWMSVIQIFHRIICSMIIRDRRTNERSPWCAVSNRMCCDLAGSVGSQQHWLWDMAEKEMNFYCFLLFWDSFNCS